MDTGNTGLTLTPGMGAVLAQGTRECSPYCLHSPWPQHPQWPPQPSGPSGTPSPEALKAKLAPVAQRPQQPSWPRGPQGPVVPAVPAALMAQWPPVGQQPSLSKALRALPGAVHMQAWPEQSSWSWGTTCPQVCSAVGRRFCPANPRPLCCGTRLGN